MKEKRIKNKPNEDIFKYIRKPSILFDDSEFDKEIDDKDIPILEEEEIDELVKMLK